MEIGDKEIEAVNGKILKIEFLQAGDKIREIVLKDGNRNYWKFADSFWLIPTSLKKAAESFSVETQKGSIDYDSISFNDYRSRRYCLDDCRALRQVIESYFEQDIFKGLRPKGTIASNAMQIYRTTIKTSLKSISKDMEHFIRRGYFGGRVEIFKMIGSDLNVYDFNSLYPAVMVENSFPVGLPAWVSRFEKGVDGFYEAEIDYDDSVNIPALPVSRDGKLIFPVGKFSGVFSSIELEASQRSGASFKVKKGVIFHVSKNIFKKYVSDLYHLKENSHSDSAMYLMTKLYLNGLYGKFGQRRTQSSIIRCSFKDAAKEGLVPYMPEHGLFIKQSESKGAYILPHIAAWVTSHARLKLFSRLNESTYYCDTDSVFTSENLENDSKRLGALKFEKKVSEAVFLLPKVYHLSGSGSLSYSRVKGFTRDSVKHLNIDDFKAALSGNRKSFNIEYKKLFGIKESLRRFGKCPVSGIAVKSLKQIYNKRIIMPDYSTKPLVLNEFS